MSKGAVQVEGLTVELGATPALISASLSVSAGGRLAVLGASGAGKTTLLRALAGLETPSGGTIRLSDREVSGPRKVLVPPEQRRVSLVFQSLALWPHMTVERTLAYVSAGPSPRELAERVGLGNRLDAYPEELSGGEQQRLALARALATQPDLLLLDEPFAHLDAPLRQRLGESLLELVAEQGTTLVVATHQREVALQLADELVVLDHGAVRDRGSLDEVTLRPTSATTARLLDLGSVVEGELAGEALKTPFGDLSLDGEGQDPCALVRPEQVRWDGEVQAVVVSCEVGRPEAVRGRYLVTLEAGGQRLRAVSDERQAPGSQATVRVDGAVRRLAR